MYGLQICLVETATTATPSFVFEPSVKSFLKSALHKYHTELDGPKQTITEWRWNQSFSCSHLQLWQRPAYIIWSIQISSSVLPFVKSVRNLGVILDLRLSMKEHINKVCQMAYWVPWRISVQTLVVSLILSHLDSSNCFLAGVPECILHKLQKIQNTSARLIKSSWQEHTKSLIKALHWLAISDI